MPVIRRTVVALATAITAAFVGLASPVAHAQPKAGEELKIALSYDPSSLATALC